MYLETTRKALDSRKLESKPESIQDLHSDLILTSTGLTTKPHPRSYDDLKAFMIQIKAKKKKREKKNIAAQ